MYYRKIDGLRFVAIIVVMFAHLLYFVEQTFHLAYYGVDLFFTISGFLITGILIKQSSGSVITKLKNFFGRRFLRIFPVYYLSIAILYLLGFPEVVDHLIYYVTFTYNYAEVILNIPVNNTTHFWSLCVEEQFYIIWPLLIFGLSTLSGKFKSRSTQFIYLAIIISVLAIIAVWQRYYGIFSSITRFNNHGLLTNMFSLCIGALTALIQSRGKPGSSRILKNRFIEYAVLIILIAVLYKDSQIKYLLCPFISAFFILKAVNDLYTKPLDKFLSNKVIVWIGTISYGLYLFHWPISYYVNLYFFDPFWKSIPFETLGVFKVLKWNPWIISFPLNCFLSILVAYLSFHFFEQPILKYKDRLFPLKNKSISHSVENLIPATSERETTS